jgi:hypothetical protein
MRASLVFELPRELKDFGFLILFMKPSWETRNGYQDNDGKEENSKG